MNMEETEDINWSISDLLFQRLIADARDLKFLKAYGVEGWEFYAEAISASEGISLED